MASSWSWTQMGWLLSASGGTDEVHSHIWGIHYYVWDRIGSCFSMQNLSFSKRSALFIRWHHCQRSMFCVRPLEVYVQNLFVFISAILAVTTEHKLSPDSREGGEQETFILMGRRIKSFWKGTCMLKLELFAILWFSLPLCALCPQRTHTVPHVHAHFKIPKILN